MSSIFVSYSRQDTDFALELVDRLKKKGHTVWMDQISISGGANYFKKIAEGIEKAEIVIPVLSPNSVSSDWVEREIFYSVEKKKIIVPVLAEFTEIPEGLKFALAGIHHVDFTPAQTSHDPWLELEQALTDSDSLSLSYQGFYEYLLQNVRRRKINKRVKLGATILVCLFLGILLGKYILSPRLPDPKDIHIKGVTAEVQDAIRLVYSTPLEQITPSASVAVLVQKKGGDASQWRFLIDGEELSSNDNYAFMFQPDKETYFYIFQIDSTGKLDWLFPQNPYLSYSSGQNPVLPGKWTILPEQQNEAFYLDENLGVEHFYIVVTSKPWSELENTLAKASKSGNLNKPIMASFSLKTRGAAGKRWVQADLPANINIKSENIKQLVTGKAGILVVEKWFRHIKP